MNLVKKCSKCDEYKELVNYSRKTKSSDGRYAYCKPCEVIVNRLKYLKRRGERPPKPPKSPKPSKPPKQPNPPKQPREFKGSYFAKYGITINQYNQLFLNQNGCCKICNKHQAEFKQKLSVDHCHKTGRVRGLLCRHCNFGLGFAKDDISILENMIKYLKQFI